jgi:hypothetical protein
MPRVGLEQEDPEELLKRQIQSALTEHIAENGPFQFNQQSTAEITQILLRVQQRAIDAGLLKPDEGSSSGTRTA